MKRKHVMIAALGFLLAIGSAFVPKANQKAMTTNLWQKVSGSCTEFDCETNFTISCNNFYPSLADCQNQTGAEANNLKHE